MKIVHKILTKRKKTMISLFILYLISGLLVGLIPVLQKELIDYISSSFLTKVVQYSLSIIAISLVSMILSYIASLQSLSFSNGVLFDMNEEFLIKLSAIQYKEFENKENLDVFERIKKLGNAVSSSFLSLSSILLHLFSIVSLSLSLGSIRWYLAVLTILLTIPYLILLNKQSFDSYILEVNHSTDTRRIDYLFQALTHRDDAKEIRLFQIGPYLQKKYFDIRNRLWREKRKMLLKHSFWTIAIMSLKNISLGTCILITCYFIIQGSETIGSLSLVISAASGIIGNIVKLTKAFSDFRKQQLYLKDYARFFDLPDETLSLQRMDMQSQDIIFENVSFQYPGAQRDTLKNINLKIHKGEKIAIVGHNGSGKTTFVHLLIGLYTPTEGKIKIGSAELEDVMDDFRTHTACVFQDFIRYQYTLDENLLWYGQNTEIEKLCKEVFLDFIEERGLGFDQQLGNIHENGIELSGGEWQKIAMMRALNKPDTSYLILDEPTSSLDPKVESELYTHFHRFSGQKTTLLISHRLASAPICDRILVFENGEIVEDGHHNQLIAQKGISYHMFTTQQSLYDMSINIQG